MMNQVETPRLSSRPDNMLLAALAPGDRDAIVPCMERVWVETGARLFDPGDPIDALYFPEDALVSIGERLDDGRHVEIGLSGREGMIGWPALLGSARSLHGAVVQMNGGAMLRIPAQAMLGACRASSSLLTTLLRFVAVASVQMARLVVSHLHDPIEVRLARWMLMRHDRVVGDELLVKHEDVSANLGVRRASVTEGMHILEGERLIRCNRGRIVMRDRDALERRAGHAYGIPERHYRDMIGPFGKPARPDAAAPLFPLPHDPAPQPPPFRIIYGH